MKTNFLYVLALLGIATGLSTSGIAVADEYPHHLVGEEALIPKDVAKETSHHVLQHGNPKSLKAR